MSSDKIKAWEVLLADAIGEDAAIRILYDTAAQPLRWISSRSDKPVQGRPRCNRTKR